MMQALLKQKKTFIKFAALIFFTLSVVVLLFTSYIQYSVNQVKKNDLLNNEQNLIRTENTIISNRISRISGDLLHIADSFALNDNGDGDYSQVEKLWVAFSNRKMIYDQIRYIDVDGNEIIRVNYDSEGAQVVEEENLQNKKDRYYFEDTLSLEEDQVYISKLDLNVENNQIEQNAKPMIRISTPYYRNGTLEGIFVLNYFADDILGQVAQASTASNGEVFMLNSDGYWLYNSASTDKEWGFMYSDKADINFANEYPAEWEAIQKETSGYEITENGAFIYSNVIASDIFSQENNLCSFVLGSGDWMIVSHLTAESEAGLLVNQSLGAVLFYTLQKNFYFYIIILFIALILSALIALSKNEKEQIKYFSEIDVMTGVYNRRAGFEKLAQLQKKVTNKSRVVSVCFIDINGLKEVNDTLGHEIGDELICSIVGSIENNTRGNDFVARLGGDEFLIIFEGIDAAESEAVWQRIVNEIDTINSTENRQYLISASHGIESFDTDSDQNIDEIVNLADEKMYQEKRQIKKELKVLKTTKQ